jgi:hypothetical protein
MKSGMKNQTTENSTQKPSDFDGVVYASSGGGLSILSSSIEELKNAPEEIGKAILANATTKIITKSLNISM